MDDDEQIVREALTHQMYPGEPMFGLAAVTRAFAAFDNIIAELRRERSRVDPPHGWACAENPYYRPATR